MRSSPTAPRRELGLRRVQRIAREATELGVKEIFITGGEPFLLEDIGEILSSCAAAAPTTVLTNGMLFTGRRAEALRALPRDGVVLQISLDSGTPELHDLHRGPGTGARTREGIQRARVEGFRVRLAATVSSDAEAEEFRQFLDEEKIAAEDRVIRRVALRGAASEGVAVTRSDLVPEVTITAEGVYWHPVGAEDSDLLVTRDIFPLAESFAAVRRAFDREGEHANKLARIFNFGIPSTTLRILWRQKPVPSRMPSKMRTLPFGVLTKVTNTSSAGSSIIPQYPSPRLLKLLRMNP